MNLKSKIYGAFLYSLLLSASLCFAFLFFFSVNKSFSDAKLFSAIFIVGHSFEFGLVFFLLNIFFVWLPRKLYMVVSALIAFIFYVFIIADFITYRQFRFHISLSELNMFFGEDAGDIFQFPLSMYLQIGIYSVITLSLSIILRLLANYLATKKIKKYVICASAVFLLSLLSYNAMYVWNNFQDNVKITKQTIVLPLAFPLTMNGFLERRGFQAPEKVQLVESSIMNYPLEMPNIKIDNESMPNIVLILMDGWRYDMFNDEITPNIYNFSKNASVFRQHISNSNHTRHGVFSLFYSLFGNYWQAALQDRISPVFIDILVERGYQMGIFSSSSLRNPEFNKTIFSKIENLRVKSIGNGAAERDINITEEAIEFINERDISKPFFAFLFYDATHAYSFDKNIFPPKFSPYNTKNYMKEPKESDRELILNQYKNSIGFDDFLISRFLNELTEQNLLENTIVIITSDHGEEFNDLGQNYWGHNGNYSKYQTQVPLIIYWKSKEKTSYSHLTSHVDIVPTILKHAFLSDTEFNKYSNGSDLFEKDGREYIYIQGNEYALVADGIITIFRKFKSLENVTADNQPTEQKANSEKIRAALNEMQKFKK